MGIVWTQHAMERFLERALLYGFSRAEIEEIIRKQQVRIDCGFDEKYKTKKFETIGIVMNKFFTIEKAEDKKKIIVITLWESDKKEAELWLAKQK
ncbi:MAG: hypothetical protein PHD95_04630 [Candidatus ainarchaeum sp.]|nr:hypothetical protein [Candidatus ainarchaeum sp.]